MIRIIVTGCTGRMGKRILTLAYNDPHFVVGGAVERKEHPAIGSDSGEVLGCGKKKCTIVGELEEVVNNGDIIIEFTSPKATIAHVRTALAHNKKMVIGTTGLSEDEQAVICDAAKNIPIVFAPNMSVGVNVLFKLSHMVARTLDDEYDVEIIEAHHKHKKDAPSGTAREIARLIALGRNSDLAQQALYGREGMCGERKKGAIGIHAIRGGDVVGEHTVSFMTEGERIELVHKASSRDAFAKGALIAARFIDTKNNGLFSMQDVLGIAQL